MTFSLKYGRVIESKIKKQTSSIAFHILLPLELKCDSYYLAS